LRKRLSLLISGLCCFTLSKALTKFLFSAIASRGPKTITATPTAGAAFSIMAPAKPAPRAAAVSPAIFFASLKTFLFGVVGFLEGDEERPAVESPYFLLNSSISFSILSIWSLISFLRVFFKVYTN